MNFNGITSCKEVKCKNREILLEVALSLNKELFDENKVESGTFELKST